MIYSPSYWSEYIRTEFIPLVDAYKEILLQRTIPAFETLEREAEGMSEKEYERLCNLPAKDYYDLGDCVAKAEEIGISYYINRAKLKDAMVGLFAVGLFHMLEQHLFYIYRKSMIPYVKDVTTLKYRNFKDITAKYLKEGIDLKACRSYRDIDTLRLVCNVVKHAEGTSAAELRKRKPEYFDLSRGLPPSFKNRPIPSIPITQPMSGEDIVIRASEFEEYCKCVKAFWMNLSEKLT